MSDAEMERLADTEFGIRKMLSEVSKVLGSNDMTTYISSKNRPNHLRVPLYLTALERGITNE
jgi:hypothetical protein